MKTVGSPRGQLGRVGKQVWVYWWAVAAVQVVRCGHTGWFETWSCCQGEGNGKSYG